MKMLLNQRFTSMAIKQSSKKKLTSQRNSLLTGRLLSLKFRWGHHTIPNLYFYRDIGKFIYIKLKKNFL
ncbi:MAG: hypothetical protein CM15mP29_3660 [Alphaproteobacteria bacterium]|nr:MAG: hypothetical protein CM15mP29_3660 [Alphaproteobacteria bacterium]